MEEKIAGQLLAQPGPALVLQVQRFGRPDHFDVHAIGLGADHRILHRPVLGGRPQFGVKRPRAPRPANAPAMRVVGMEHLRTAVHNPPLDRIAQVRPRQRRRDIAEGIGAVGQGLVLEPEILMLEMHLINAERFAAVVQRAAAWTIGVGQRIPLGQEIALLVDRPEGFVTDFVIEDHVLAEIRARAVVNHHLPAAPGFGRRSQADWFKVTRALRFHHKGSKQPHHRQLAVVAVAMELADAFLHRGVDVPLHVHGLAGGQDRVRVGGGGSLAGRADDHARPMNVKAPHFILQLVTQRDLDAIALVAPDGKRLDDVALQARRNGSWIELILFVLTSGFVPSLFRAGLLDVFGQDVHVAGIVIQPPIQGDLDGDHRDVIRLHRRG